MEQQEAEPEANCKEADLARIFTDFNLDKDGANSQLWEDLLEWKRHKYWAVKKFTERERLAEEFAHWYSLSQIKINQKENT